jgi:hypothetical protein
MAECPDRENLIKEKLQKTEERAVTDLFVIRTMVKDHLMFEKGYADGDIETDRVFEIAAGDAKEKTSVDYLITLGGRRFMVIKCSPGALESRERHLISFARVVETYQIPFALVTDGNKARLLDVVKGKFLSEGFDSIPSKTQALAMIASMNFYPYPEGKVEREKRILLAFDSIKCTEESCE